MLRFPPHLIRSFPLIIAAAALACSGENLSAPTTGSVQVTVATTGADPDPDGYAVTVDGSDRGTLGVSGTLTVEGLGAGDHLVGLSGVAGNCQVQGGNPRTVSVAAGATASADFSINCTVPVPSQIVFISDQGPVRDVYIVNPDGSGLTNLTNGAAGSAEIPQWSPDRSKIVFEGGQFGGDIYVINADGTGLHNLTNTPPLEGLETEPVWSPDGTTIVFTKAISLDPDGDQAATDVYTIRADGSQLTPLTTTGQESQGGGLSWSPDGSRIAFTSDRGASSQIFVMGSDGSSQTGITSAGTSFGPQWSPDGSKIAFLTSMAAPPEVWTVNPDGTNPIQLTNEPSDGKADLRWSSDGRKIVYTFAYRPSDIGGLGSDIWTMNADGSGKVNVTNNKLDNTSPVWSPDGSQIAFVFGFGTGANAEVRVVSADGSEPQRNVSTRQGYRPDW